MNFALQCLIENHTQKSSLPDTNQTSPIQDKATKLKKSDRKMRAAEEKIPQYLHAFLASEVACSRKYAIEKKTEIVRVKWKKWVNKMSLPFAVLRILPQDVQQRIAYYLVKDCKSVRQIYNSVIKNSLREKDINQVPDTTKEKIFRMPRYIGPQLTTYGVISRSTYDDQVVILVRNWNNYSIEFWDLALRYRSEKLLIELEQLHNPRLVDDWLADDHYGFNLKKMRRLIAIPFLSALGLHKISLSKQLKTTTKHIAYKQYLKDLATHCTNKETSEILKNTLKYYFNLAPHAVEQ